MTVRLDALHAGKIQAWWFDPRTGKATSIGRFNGTGTRTFLCPTPGELLDWVLVLDDVAKRYPAPGANP